MLSLCGKQFSQNTVLYAISTISQCGSCSNGNMFAVALILFYCSYVPFYLWYMFILGSSVQVNTCHFHVFSDAFELPVHEDVP